MEVKPPCFKPVNKICFVTHSDQDGILYYIEVKHSETENPFVPTI